jgi:hypothetical protein
MSRVVLSTAYFPPIEWMAHYVQQNSITLEGHEFYQKQTYRSRAVIAGPNGSLILNVPVKRKVREIQHSLISYEEDWVKDHVKALESAYAKSPFYEMLMPDVVALLREKRMTLWELNLGTLEIFERWLDMDRKWELSERFELEARGIDLRNLSPKAKSTLDFVLYTQVFQEKIGFQNNLSALDLFFNLGRSSWDYLTELEL